MPHPTTGTTAATLCLSLACDLREVRRAASELRRFLAGQKCPQTDVTDCELALVEACNNAIQYAQGAARAAPVLVQVSCGLRVIELRITDHTAGFVMPEQLPLPNPEAERGRGLFLIRSVMQQVDYVRGDDQNTLVLRRELGHVR
jgi:anti-sigma regulatory factor (Ser/Thr protein kinase)